MRATSTPASWARQYIGIPFTMNGRERRDGLDCWGLVRLVYAERLGIILPSHTDGYQGVDDSEGLRRVLVHETQIRRAWSRREVDDIQIGDVVQLDLSKRPHVGVMVSRGQMLHAFEGSDSCIERLDAPLWERRVRGFWRYDAGVQVASRPKIFGEPTRLELPAGASIDEILVAAGVKPSPHIRVFVGDRLVPREVWAHVRPRAGRMVSISCVAAGGGNGGKTALRIIAAIAIIAVAWYLGPVAYGAYAGITTAAAVGTQGAAIATGIIGMAGTLLLSALAPPPKSRIGGNDAGVSPVITGARNEARPFGVVPEVLGDHVVAPLYAALPFTEIAGDDQYLRLLFTPGYGPVEISDLKIGDTALDEFEGVEYEFRPGLPDDAPCGLYSNTILEEGLSIELIAADGWTTRTTNTNASEISIDVTWPQGLAHYGGNGSRSNLTVALEVQYSPTGAGTWTSINVASPSEQRTMDFLFRTPEVVLGGQGSHGTKISWGDGFPDPKPGYLPASGYSWELTAWLYAPTAGAYQFGLDSSDGAEVWVDGRIVASWYGSHATAGGGTPDFAAHAGSITLTKGYHQLKVRMECRSGGGAIALGWIKPGDVAFEIVPASRLKGSANGSGSARYRWFETSVYTSSIGLTSNRAEQLRRSLAWAVEPGQYDVRVRRVTADTPSDSDVDTVYWTALRTIRNSDPIKLKNVARIAMRIKATDQLQGVVDTFNCRVRRIIPDWDAETGTWITRATSNPASCYRNVLQGPANKRPLADARIDLATLQDWHEHCEEEGFSYNTVLDSTGTVFDRLQEIAAAGRASFGMRDGKYSVVIDRPQTVPAQHLSPRNSYGFRGRRVFPELPHAVLVRFVNKENGYQFDERPVYDDGQSEETATLFESMELAGVTSWDEAWRHGRYQLAAAKLRREVYELSCDAEHLSATRGDLVLVTHDVMLVGIASGRVAHVEISGSDCIAVQLDEEIVMEDGTDYVVRFRLEDGTSLLCPVVTAAGASTRLEFSTPIPTGDPRPKVGDLALFGEAGLETRECVIKAITMDRDLAATLTLVDHAPAIHDADVGEIPAYVPGITIPPLYLDRPAAPVIESIRSDDYVMIRDADGSLRPRMVVTLLPASSNPPRPTHSQLRIRLKPDGGADPVGPWRHFPLQPIDDLTLDADQVEEGATYQVAVRYATAAGVTSLWTTTEHTIVGKVNPPPDVQAFDVVRLGDGTRRYTWDLGTIPPDIAGVVIRYGPSVAAWGSLSPLHTGLLEGASPIELNVPPAGTWYFAIKMVDTSGNESVNALGITRTLGPERREGIAFLEDARISGWPGTKTGCYVSNDTYLWSQGTETWSTLPATWDDWTSWTMDPTDPIVYQQQVDVGYVFDFSPSVYIYADGASITELQYSTDGATWSAWAVVSSFHGVTIRARHVRVRATVSSAGLTTVPVLQQLVLTLRAETKTHSIDNLNTLALGGTNRIGVGDVRLPIPAGVFGVIQSVMVSFNGTGAGWTYEIVDKDWLLGPRVRLYNAAGELADATIDATIRGL
jgi:hypothetical protein